MYRALAAKPSQIGESVSLGVINHLLIHTLFNYTQYKIMSLFSASSKS